MLDKIIKITENAGEIYIRASKYSADMGIIQKDSRVNLVTKYDKELQDYLVGELSKLLPGAGFLTEEGEGGKVLTDGWCFIIDPIDGTTNFIKGFQHSAISVGLAKDREMYCGVVLDPDLGNIFCAQKGKGAYLNGKKITVSDASLADSLVLFGTAPYDRELCGKTFKLTEKIFNASLEIRRSGSAALDICYVAAGKADLFYEMRLRPWDIAAASLILSEAGGCASCVDGSALTLGKVESFLCGNEKNIKEFYEIYNS